MSLIMRCPNIMALHLRDTSWLSTRGKLEKAMGILKNLKTLNKFRLFLHISFGCRFSGWGEWFCRYRSSRNEGVGVFLLWVMDDHGRSYSGCFEVSKWSQQHLWLRKRWGWSCSAFEMCKHKIKLLEHAFHLMMFTSTWLLLATSAFPSPENRNACILQAIVWLNWAMGLKPCWFQTWTRRSKRQLVHVVSRPGFEKHRISTYPLASSCICILHCSKVGSFSDPKICEGLAHYCDLEIFREVGWWIMDEGVEFLKYP